MSTLAAVLARAARERPEHTALVDDASARRWSFKAFVEACFSTGNFLKEKLAAGERVALLADAQPEYLFADYGAMAAGLVRVPLDPSLSAAELARQVEDAGARVLLAGASRLALAHEVAGAAGEAEVVALEEITVQKLLKKTQEPEPQALASLNYTGGTSSEPKAVMLSQANLAAIVRQVGLARGTQPGEVMLNVRPLWPIAAVIVLAHLAAGGTVVLGGGFEPRRFVELLRRHRAASTSLVPTHLVRLLRDVPPAQLAALRDLRAIEVGAAAIPQDTFQALLDALGPKIGVLYGLTEASWSCYQPPQALAGPDAAARLRSVGTPVPGCEVAISPEGEVLVRGPHVMQGYWKRPELTREALREGWFHTGDQGVLDANGVLALTGRMKEVIRSGGKSVLPEEVEAALLQHPSVAEAAVVGLPDAEWGEIVAAAIVLRTGSAVSEQDLAAHCKALSAHKRPRRFRFVQELPRSHYGKVQRGKLRALLAG